MRSRSAKLAGAFEQEFYEQLNKESSIIACYKYNILNFASLSKVLKLNFSHGKAT
jgi:hypothetical protein